MSNFYVFGVPNEKKNFGKLIDNFKKFQKILRS